MSQAEKIKILGIPGSLRNGSFNRAALRAAQMLAPQSVAVNVFELDEIPLYNQDNEFDPPIAVSKLEGDNGSRCYTLCYTRVQLLSSRGLEKCNRLGIATPW